MQVQSFGIILSEFDEILGPIPIASIHSQLDRKGQSHIATKTIDLLLQDTVLPKKASLIDFPSLNKKGLVKAFRWEDFSKRGGKGQATLSIIFDNTDDNNFYKYRDDLEPLFSDFIQQFITQRQKKPQISSFTPQLEFLLHKIESIMLYLSETEMSHESDEEFPTEFQKHEDPEMNFKVIVVGDENVGKTSTILRYVDRAFRRSYIPTIGVNVTIKHFVNDKHTYQFMLWDLAGQAKFSKIRRHFYQGTDAIIMIFDLTRPSSFQNITKWYADLKESIPHFEEKIIYLCGNKADLLDGISISKAEIQAESKRLQIPYLEISALTGKSINLLFELLGQRLVEQNVNLAIIS
jgi:small GTP-binding protein